RLFSVSRLDNGDVRQRTEQRDVADALMRLAGTGGDQARVVERVDDLRSLARLVVDLLVGARREERCKGVDDREQALPREARGHRNEILLGDPDLDEPGGRLELDGANT